MDVVLAEPTTTGVVVIILDGQLDMDSAPQLRAALDEMRATGVPRLVVDLERLRFCDSIGLSELVVASKYCTESGGFLRLAKPTPFLQRICNVVGITDTLAMYTDVDSACTGDPGGLIRGTANAWGA